MIHCSSPQMVYNKKNIPFWLISAFKAGYINTLGFLLAGEFVSHVTGFGTRVGISLGHKDYFFGLELLIIPASFIFGGVITSLILDKESPHHPIPPYYKVQSLITFVIAILMIFGEAGLITDKVQFGSDNRYTFIEITYISLLCFICGLKNSLVSWTTFGKVRVTHLTGLSTDIGLNLIRTFNPKHTSPRYNESPFINWIRIFIFASFSSGALISAMLFPSLGHRGLIIVLIISAMMTLVSAAQYWSRLPKNSPNNDHFEPVV